MIKSIMKRQILFHLAKFWMGFFCFVFEEISSAIPVLLVMLFAHGGKRSNSLSQMFFKTSVLTIFTCSLRPVHYIFPKFYLMVDNWYFRVKFYYCKIRPVTERTSRQINQNFLWRDGFLSNKISILLERFFFLFFLCYSFSVYRDL